MDTLTEYGAEFIVNAELNKAAKNVKACADDLWAVLMHDYRDVQLMDTAESNIRQAMATMQHILERNERLK